MSQQNKIIAEQDQKTPQKGLEKALRAMVTQASREKLLPKIMWKADKQFGSKKLLNYQRSVRRQNDLKVPLKYDPESAKSERQKFREKVMKLMNNQLDIEYLENVKEKDKTTIAYKGHQLQQYKIQTKKQFQMFNNFNQNRFKQTYTNIFQDKLEVGYDNLYRKKGNKRCNTLHVLQSKPRLQTQNLKRQKTPQKIQVRMTQARFDTPRVALRTQQSRENSKRKILIQYNQKKGIGKELLINEQLNVAKIMRQIGGYSHIFQQNNLSLTRGSIIRWMKTIYEKPNRLIDFLQIKDVVTFEQFWKISKRLRVMPQDHILFMTFLYYDGNNDGYICDYDLQRLANLSLKRSILAHDLNKIKQTNLKKILTKQQPYLDLYKLSQVTQTVYFQWKAKHQQGKQTNIELQMKNRLLSSRQKQIFLDFSAFTSVYKNQKPFIWYDLMHLFSGVSFQGLRYD